MKRVVIAGVIALVGLFALPGVKYLVQDLASTMQANTPEHAPYYDFLKLFTDHIYLIVVVLWIVLIAVVLLAGRERQPEIKEAIVRIRLSIPKAAEALLRDAEIYKALREAYNVTIAKEVRQESRLRLSDWARSEELTPVEAGLAAETVFVMVFGLILAWMFFFFLHGFPLLPCFNFTIYGFNRRRKPYLPCC